MLKNGLYVIIYLSLSTYSFGQDFWSINDTTKEALLITIDKTNGSFVNEEVKGDYTTHFIYKFFKFDKPLVSETNNTKIMTTGIYPDLKDFEKIVSQINISDTWRSVPFGGSYTIVGEEKTYLCFLGKGTPDEGFYILDGIWKKISAPIETKMFAISKNGSDTISLNAKKSLVVAIGCIAQVKEPQKDFIITVNNEGILSIIGKKK